VGPVLPLRPAPLVAVHPQQLGGPALVVAVPYVWLLLFFLVPFLIVLKISFAEFSPLAAAVRTPSPGGLENGALQLNVLFSTYDYLFLHEPLYVSAWLYSIKVAFFSTAAVPADRLIRWPTPSRAPRPPRATCC
jgi:ABC-type spermidine/putrescine transport system permease subunit I